MGSLDFFFFFVNGTLYQSPSNGFHLYLCFVAFLVWIITFWDDVSCQLGHSHHTPSPLPLRLPLTLLCCRHVFWQRWLRGKRDWGILAAVPGRLQMPLPQQWEFSGSHPQGMHFQMAQLAGRSDLSPWGLNHCQALLRTRYSTVFNKAFSRKCPHCDGWFVHVMKMRIMIKVQEVFLNFF